MSEEFLQYIWGNNLFYENLLATTEGEKVEIISTGQINTNSGPDFFNAKVIIGDTLWAGNIEIHKKASDWGLHKHSEDKSYENVVLHVVEVFDKSILRKDGTEIPTLVFRYPLKYKLNYLRLLDSNMWIACQDNFHKIDSFLKSR